jgi:hypothetical protein
VALPTQTVGTTITAAIWNAVIAAINALAPATSTITTTGVSNLLSIPSGSVELTIFANNGSLLTINGLAAGLDGQRLSIFSIGGGQVDIAHQNTGAAAGNRIVNTVSGTISLAPGSGHVDLVYDGTASRWRVLHHEQGASIDFASTAAVVGFSSLSANDFSYILRGRLLFIRWNVIGTSNADVITFTIPYTAAKPIQLVMAGFTQDNGAYTTTPGQVSGGFGASNQVKCWANYNASSGALFTTSGQKGSSGEMFIEVAS